MKTKLIFLVMLIVCLSCGTNNKPVSDAQKEKTKGQVKELVNTFYKGCEEVNFDMAMKPWLDSPDFVYINNGYAFSYKECVDVFKPVFSTMLNQKITIVDEKYAFPYNSTVLYTNHCKSLTNYKDGHSVLQDPTVMLIVFKKINDEWKAIYGVESYIAKNAISEGSKELNQVELLRKFVGNWEIPAGKDTSELVTIKSLKDKNVLDVYAKWVTKGKMLFEAMGFWAYDATLNKIDISIVVSSGEVIHDQGIFTSSNTMEFANINNSKLYVPDSKMILEFKSPDEITETTLANIKVPPAIWKRIKN